MIKISSGLWAESQVLAYLSSFFELLNLSGMKCLIVYRSRHGTTQKVVYQLAMGLAPAEVVTIDLNVNSNPDLSLFDTIIIGGSIHAGQIQKEITRFCQVNRVTLLTKRVGLFICFMNKKDGQQELQNAFPQELIQHAEALGLMGGELLFEKMNFIERLIVRRVSGVKQTVSALNQEAITSFLTRIREFESTAVV